jgi:hypothetical protein
MKRRVAFFAVCTLLACACWVAWAIHRDKRLEQGFDGLKRGDSESEVVQSLGVPKRVEHCGDFMGPLSKAELEGCVREYLYASPFSPLVPQYYVVRFDAKDRVSSATPYSSP